MLLKCTFLLSSLLVCYVFYNSEFKTGNIDNTFLEVSTDLVSKDEFKSGNFLSRELDIDSETFTNVALPTVSY